MIYIYGIAENHKRDMSISATTFFEEYEYNIEQLLTASSMGVGNCETVMLTNDLLWLEELMLVIAQYKRRYLNANGEDIDNRDIWHIFNLDCVRKRFLCRHNLDILKLGRDNDLLLTEEICDDISDQGNRGGGSGTGGTGSGGNKEIDNDKDKCIYFPYYNNIGDDKIEIMLKDVHDLTGMIIDANVRFTRDDTYKDRVILTFTGGTKTTLTIEYDGCIYPLDIDTNKCEHRAEGYYDKETDSYIVTIYGPNPVVPTFSSKGYNMSPDYYNVSVFGTTTTLTIPNASHFAGDASAFIDYGCGNFFFTIPAKDCNTDIIGYDRDEDDLYVNLAAKQSRDGNFPPATNDITVRFNNVTVPFEIVDGKIKIIGYGTDVDVDGVLSITINGCLTYTIAIIFGDDQVLPSPYTEETCGTKTLESDGTITTKPGCDKNTYLIISHYDEPTKTITREVRLIETVYNGCRIVTEEVRHRCINNIYQQKTITKSCCLTENGMECVDTEGAWTNVNISPEENPCGGIAPPPDPYILTICGTITTDEMQEHIIITPGCDRNTYLITYRYDSQDNMLKQDVELTQSVVNGCRTTATYYEEDCDGDIYKRRLVTVKCCFEGEQENCETIYGSWEVIDVSPEDNPCLKDVIIPEPYEMTVCGVVTLENGNIKVTPGKDRNKYIISYSYDIATGSVITVITLVSSVIDGCKSVQQLPDQTRCNGNVYQKRTVTNVCIPTANGIECNIVYGEWENVIFDDPNDNPCLNPPDIIIPENFTWTLCGAVSLGANNEFVVSSGCDLNTYYISYSLNTITEELEIIITLTNTVVNSPTCQSTDVIIEKDCILHTGDTEKKWSQRTITKKCCNVNGQLVCDTTVGPWTVILDEQNRCGAVPPVVVPDDEIRSICGVLSLNQQGNIVESYDCNKRTYEIKYTYNAATGDFDKSLRLMSTEANGCRTTTNLPDEIRCEKVGDNVLFQKRTVQIVCCPGANGIPLCNYIYGNWITQNVPDEDNPCIDTPPIPPSETFTVCGTAVLQNGVITYNKGCDRNTYNLSYVYNTSTKTFDKVLTPISSQTDGCKTTEQLANESRCEIIGDVNTYQERTVTLVCCPSNSGQTCNRVYGQWMSVTPPDPNPCEEDIKEKEEVICKVICHNGYLTEECITQKYVWEDDEWIEDGNPTTSYTPTSQECVEVSNYDYCVGTTRVRQTTTKTYQYNQAKGVWEWSVSTAVNVLAYNSPLCGYTLCDESVIINYTILEDIFTIGIKIAPDYNIISASEINIYLNRECDITDTDNVYCEGLEGDHDIIFNDIDIIIDEGYFKILTSLNNNNIFSNIGTCTIVCIKYTISNGEENIEECCKCFIIHEN